MSDSLQQRDVCRLFRALSDLTRLRLLNLLRDGEVCVCDLVAVLDQPQPTVSRHLAYLRRTGLALVRTEGQWHFYRLANPTGEFHQNLLQCVAAAAGHVPQLASDTERLRLGPRSNCCD